MSKNKASKFKVGDKVYSLRNSVWGRKPMKVVGVYNDSISCDNPSIGCGAFKEHTLCLASEMSAERLEQLRMLKDAERLVKRLTTQLFGPNN